MDEPESITAQRRLISLDAYRGLTMLTMASGGLGITRLAREAPDSVFLKHLALQFDHVPWRGCAFWDLIQPSFMFIVGVAMPFSYAHRQAKGDSWLKMFGHALYRSALLVFLGVFLASQGTRQPNFTFANVLAQIGLGYMVVFLLLNRPVALQVLAVLAVLVVDWALFAKYPLPDADFAWNSVGVSSKWDHLTGFDAHWDKNANFASHADEWFLNQFPRLDDKPFRFNEGGYTTLNFLPSIATMLLGVLAGQWLAAPTKRSPASKVPPLLVAGVLALVAGTALDAYHICPIVKRIWTPSWVIYSTGWALLQLALFFWIVEVQGFRRWAFPLLVVGANSIAIYMMAQLMKPFIRNTLRTWFGRQIFDGFYGPLKESVAVLFVMWLICYWMYRRKIFLKI
jgi:heparan-alpha-glucosaminide N-acetyltransferase